MGETTPRIYVACLAAYNNGYLHGEWINEEADASEWRQYLDTSPQLSLF
ncbi:antirestriction protein ArdA [Sphingobium amiense]|nr:antirestriction protein ArdA [Sphingobium amiense]